MDFCQKSQQDRKAFRETQSLLTLLCTILFFFKKQKQILSIWTNKVVFPKDILRVDIFALVYIGHSEVLCSLGTLLNEEFIRKGRFS